MKLDTATGALFFAKYYMALKDWSIATNDTYMLKKIALPSCKTCGRWNNIIDGYARQGTHARGGRLTIGESRVVHGNWDVRSDYVVDIKFTQAPITIISKGSAPSTQASKPVNAGSLVFVSWAGGAWKIVEEERDS